MVALDKDSSRQPVPGQEQERRGEGCKDILTVRGTPRTKSSPERLQRSRRPPQRADGESNEHNLNVRDLLTV